MSNTTVDSKKIKKQDNPALAGSQMIPTDENRIEIPPKVHSYGVSYNEVKNQLGIEISVGKYDAVRDDNKEVIVRVDKNDNILSQADRELSTEERKKIEEDEKIQFVMMVHPILGKVLGNRKLAKSSKEGQEYGE